MATILVVDDRLINRDFLVTLLRYAGHQVLEAADGAEALEVVRTAHPDLAIVDLVMPKMDGYAFVHQLRAEPAIAHTRVIFYTVTYLQAEAWALAQICGVQHIITKPAQPEAVLRSVAEALARAPSAAPALSVEEFQREHLRVLTDKLFKQVQALEHEVDERRQLEQEREALYQLTHDLARTSDIRTAGEYLFAQTKKILGAESGYLLLSDARRTELHGVAAYGVVPDNFVQERVSLDEPAMISLAGHKREVIVMKDFPHSPLISERLRKKYPSVQELWSVPLVSGEQLVGVFSVGYLTPQEASAEKLRFLRLLGDEAALALERIRLAEGLRESEERFRSAFEYASIGMALLSPEGRWLRVNPAFCQMLGYAEQELLGITFQSITHPEDLQTYTEGYRQLLAGECAALNWEKRYFHRAGHIIWVNASTTVVRNSAGNLLYLVSQVQDITERKQAEELLQRERDFTTAVLNTVGALIVVLDRQGYIVRFNAACERATRYSFAEVRGRHIGELLLPEERESALAIFSELIHAKRSEGRYETHLLAQDGSRHLIAWSYTRLLNAAGAVEYVISTGIDITEQKKAEEALRKLSGQLLQLQDEERRRLARELHDSTAQNLTAVAVNLAVVNDSAALEPRARHLLAESITLVQGSVREIRTLSYLLHPPLLEQVGLASALSWYGEGFTRRSGIQVHLDVSPELGRLPQDVELALFRIVQESLANIHRHSASATANIHLARDSGQIVLTVADQGHGMPAELEQNIHSSDLVVGVGLAGLRERVRQLGGQLDIRSGPHGTTLTVTLPVEGGNA